MMSFFLPVEHVLQSRQRKCKGFAAASLGDSDDVAAAADDRPALGLDRGGLVKIFHHTHDFCVRAEVRKVLDRFVGLAQSACNWIVVKLVNIRLCLLGRIGCWIFGTNIRPCVLVNVKTRVLKYLSSSSCASPGRHPRPLLEQPMLLWSACRRSF